MANVTSIRSVVESAIQRASSATGVDFTFLMGTAKRESGYNPAAKARTSSASGLFQFVDQTWLSTLKKHGSKYGYARYADLIQQGSDGKYRVTGDEARKAVLGLKLDPHAASLMAGELASDHASYLRGRVGRSPTSGELYAAHFLGPQGSARLIEAAGASPGRQRRGDVPRRGGANRSIFYREGRAATVSEVYANLTKTAAAARFQPRRPRRRDRPGLRPVRHRPPAGAHPAAGGAGQPDPARLAGRRRRLQPGLEQRRLLGRPDDQLDVLVGNAARAVRRQRRREEQAVGARSMIRSSRRTPGPSLSGVAGWKTSEPLASAQSHSIWVPAFAGMSGRLGVSRLR
jgi:hypothetical protein